MNAEDDLAGLNRRTASVRRYWPQRRDPLVRRWLRSWIDEMRGVRRSLYIYDHEELVEGKSIFLRTSYLNVLTNV